MTATCKCGFIFLIFLLVQLFPASALKKTPSLENKTLKRDNASFSSKNYIFWHSIGMKTQRKDSVSDPTKENDNFKNIENILFNRKLLKHNVLHYLWTHPRKLHSITSDIVSRKRRVPSYRKRSGANPQKRRLSVQRSPILVEKTEKAEQKFIHGPYSIQRESVRHPADPVNRSLYDHASSHFSRKGHFKNNLQLRQVKRKPGTDVSTMEDVIWSKHSSPNGGIYNKKKHLTGDHRSEFVFDKVNRQELLQLLQKSFSLGGLVVEPFSSQSPHRYKQIEPSTWLRQIDSNRRGKRNMSHKNELKKKSYILGSHRNRSGNNDLIVKYRHAKKDVVVRGKSHARNGHKRKKSVRPRDSKTSRFLPSWKSLDKRVIPSWYDDAKFGIFVHWGLYSVPSFDSEWFWFQWKGRHLPKYLNYTEKNYPPGFSYADFAPMFKAEFFDPRQWAQLVARSGARYVVLQSHRRQNA